MIQIESMLLIQYFELINHLTTKYTSTYEKIQHQRLARKIKLQRSEGEYHKAKGRSLCHPSKGPPFCVAFQGTTSTFCPETQRHLCSPISHRTPCRQLPWKTSSQSHCQLCLCTLQPSSHQHRDLEEKKQQKKVVEKAPFGSGATSSTPNVPKPLKDNLLVNSKVMKIQDLWVFVVGMFADGERRRAVTEFNETWALGFWTSVQKSLTSSGARGILDTSQFEGWFLIILSFSCRSSSILLKHVMR